MDFKEFGKEGAPKLLLIPGLGVSYEIFLPLIDLLKDQYRILAVQVDGFTLGRKQPSPPSTTRPHRSSAM